MSTNVQHNQQQPMSHIVQELPHQPGQELQRMHIRTRGELTYSEQSEIFRQVNRTSSAEEENVFGIRLRPEGINRDIVAFNISVRAEPGVPHQ